MPKAASVFKCDDSWEIIIFSSKGLNRISLILGGSTYTCYGVSSNFYSGVGSFFSFEGGLGLEL